MLESKTEALRTAAQRRLRTELEQLDFTEGGGITRLRVDVPGTDPWTWLKEQPQADKFYWQSRDGRREIAGAGVADGIDEETHGRLADGLETLRQRVRAADCDLRYYGGVAFDPQERQRGGWRPLGRYRFWVPRFEVRREETSTTLSMTVFPDDDRGRLARCLNALGGADVPLWENRVCARDVTPSRSQWCEQLVKLRDELDHDLEKLVLACRERIHCDAVVEPMALFEAVRQPSRPSFEFFLSGDGWAFLGCSPERLYARRGRTVESEAMAGTQSAMPRSSGSLLDSHKDNVEHDYVVRDMLEAFDRLEGTLERPPSKRVVRWNSLRHLSTPLVGTLPRSCTDTGILQTLHPSAAVLGYPRALARRRLPHYESFQRGWYSGPVGWIGREDAEFAVAIRSALVLGKTLEVYAGAGIVKGSDPQREWNEIQSKMRHYHDALGISQSE